MEGGLRLPSAIVLAVSAASAGLSVGVAVGRSGVAAAPPVIPAPVRADPPMPDPVELRDGVPGSSVQPVVSVDLYVERMGRLRALCVSAGNRFGVVAVEEGVFGECWDYRIDDRAWAEWVAVRR